MAPLFKDNNGLSGEIPKEILLLTYVCKYSHVLIL